MNESIKVEKTARTTIKPIVKTNAAIYKGSSTTALLTYGISVAHFDLSVAGSCVSSVLVCFSQLYIIFPNLHSQLSRHLLLHRRHGRRHAKLLLDQGDCAAKDLYDA